MLELLAIAHIAASFVAAVAEGKEISLVRSVTFGNRTVQFSADATLAAIPDAGAEPLNAHNLYAEFAHVGLQLLEPNSDGLGVSELYVTVPGVNKACVNVKIGARMVA